MTEQNGFNPSDIQNMDPKKENAFQADNAATDHGTWEKADDGVAAASSDTAAGSPYTDGSVPADAPDLNSAESIPSADAYTDPTGFGTQADASYPYYGTQETPYPPYTPQKRKAKAKKEKKPHHGAWLALVIACAFLFSFAGGAAGFAVAQNGVPFFNNASGSSGSESSSGDSVLQTGDGSSTAATTTSEVTELVANSVVEITTESVTTGSFFEQQILTGAGSGVIVTADGYIVTNNHVIEDSSRITVTLRDGTQYDATLVGTDEKTDLAVLKIDASGLQPAVFGSSSDLKVGEQAIVIGNPLGQLGGSVTSGIISALDREITVDGHTMALLQTDAAVNPGNSGGGLFNANGELVGIINAKSSGDNVEGLGFAIPSDTVKEVVDAIIQNGYVPGRVSLGLSVVDITDAQTAMMYRVDTLGVYILSVNEGSNAEKAGLQAGDRITAIGDKEVSSTSDITTALDEYSVGDQVQITIVRDGRTGTAAITLEEQSHTSSES